MKIIEAEEVKKYKNKLKVVGFEESSDDLSLIMKKEILEPIVKFKKDVVMIFLSFDKMSKETEIICFDKKNEKNDTIFISSDYFEIIVNNIISKLEFEYFEDISDITFDWERENENLIEQFKENLKNNDLEKVLIEGLLSEEKTVKGTIMLSFLDKKIIDILGNGFARSRNQKFTKLINFLFSIIKSPSFYQLIFNQEVRSQLLGNDNEILEYELKKIKNLYKSQSINKKIDEILKNLK